jgi:hypothetical protein
MEILAHRGWWTSREHQNSLDALTRALTAGFGVEADIRDCAGRLATVDTVLNIQDMTAPSKI